MKKLITVFFITFFIVQQMVFAGLGNDFWNSYKEVLKKIVSVNMYMTIDGEFNHSSVDYKKINNDTDIMKMIIHQRNKLEFGKAPEGIKHKLAFWINAYNFFTIEDIVINYPVASMKKVGWKKKRHNVGGTLYSLDDIEHNILRSMKDPRMHFAINCASVGCPSLSIETFTGDNINEQLDRAVINALKNPLHLRLISNSKAHTTQLFSWFGNDFKTSEYEGVADLIHKFAPERFRKINKIETKIKYNWSLNIKQNVLKIMNELREKFAELKLKGE